MDPGQAQVSPARRRWRAFLAGLGLVASWGSGSCDDAAPASNTGGAGGTSADASAGSAGVSGSGGNAGSGGASGSGGTAGTGGVSATGGATGSSGASGSSGATGMGGASGSGGTAGGAGGSAGNTGDAGSAVPPWHTSIYGTISEGAVFIFSEPYVTLSGSPARVTAVQNAANPGVRDMTFAAGAEPIWRASGGSDGRPYAEFDGSNDVGVARGFSFSQQAGTNELCMQVIGRFRSIAELTQATGVYARSAGNPDYHFRTFQVWSSQNFDYYRTNGYPVGFPHHIQYLTPEASNDIGWQLHEGYAIATGIIAFRNGVQFGPGGNQGLLTDSTNPIDEIRIGCDDRGGCAPVDVHEVVITEGRALTQLSAYRRLRVAPLYRIAIQ